MSEPGVPTIHDTPRETLAVDGVAGRIARLRRALGSTGTVVVALDPAGAAGDVVVPWAPLAGREEEPMAAAGRVERPWVRLDVQGWEAAALASLAGTGLLERAAAVELEVGVAGGVVRSPTLEEAAALLPAHLAPVLVEATQVDPGTGATWAARAVFAPAQPRT